MPLITMILAVLLIITALGTIYYWVDFFIRGGPIIEDEWYIKFEKAFPIADLWGLVACSLIGAAGLLTEQPYGSFFSLLAAGSMIFLALMDITFCIENNLYSLIATSNKMVIELGINMWTLLLGIGLIVYLWPILA